MANQRTVSQVVLEVFIPLSCVSIPFKAHGQAANRVASGSLSLHTTFVHINFVQGPWPSNEPCHKWFFMSSYYFCAYQFRLRPMAKQRTVSQVILQVFIPLSRVSVPFKAHGQATNRAASGSSSFHTTFVRISSVQGPGPRPSGEPCRKWFFKSSPHFRAYRFRLRLTTKRRTVSQVVIQVFIPLSCVSVPFKAYGQAVYLVTSGSSNDCSTYTSNNTSAMRLLELHKQQYKRNEKKGSRHLKKNNKHKWQKCDLSTSEHDVMICKNATINKCDVTTTQVGMKRLSRPMKWLPLVSFQSKLQLSWLMVVKRKWQVLQDTTL